MSDEGEDNKMVIRDGYRGEIVDGYFFPIERADVEDKLWATIEESFEVIFSRPSHAPRAGDDTRQNEALRPTGYRPDTTGVSMSYARNDCKTAASATLPRAKGGGLRCAEVGLIAAVVTGLIIFMMVMS